jgi:integrase
VAKKRANNEGTIYKLPSGSWCAQLSLEGRRMSKTFRTQKEALEWNRLMRGQIDDGLTYSSAQMTLGEYMSNWLTNTQSSKRPRTWEQCRQVVQKHILPSLGPIRMKNLHQEHIQAFYNRLLEQDTGIYTIRKIHDILHSAFEPAVNVGMLKRNPTSFVHVPKLPDTEMTILNDSQVSQFLVSLNGHRWEALFVLAIITGARQMELLGLKWADLDWDRRTLKITRQLNRPDGSGVSFSAPKTRHGKRTIPLGVKTIDILRKHYQLQQAERQAAAEAWQEHDLIFTTSNGTPIHPRNLLRDFKILLRNAGLPAIRFHDLRHTAASLMLNDNIAPIMVSRYLGHARASITMDIYAHLIPTMQAEVADRIDDLILPVPVQLNPTEVNH